MVKNRNNIPSYAEMFDAERIREIAEDVMRGKHPNANYSDLECNIWEIIDWVRYHSAEKEA